MLKLLEVLKFSYELEFTTVDAALQAVLSGNPLVGMLFHRNGSHFDALEVGEGARDLLSDRTYCTIMLSSATVSMTRGCQPLLGT